MRDGVAASVAIDGRVIGADTMRARWQAHATGRAVSADENFVDCAREDFDRLEARQQPLHFGSIGVLVALRARAAHRWTLARVENLELDARCVGGESHDAAERVDFPHHLAFGQSADGGVAAHLSDARGLHRHKRDASARTKRSRCSARGLGARVTSADDDDIKSVGGGGEVGAGVLHG